MGPTARRPSMGSSGCRATTVSLQPGYVDAATQRALEDTLAELGRQAAEQELTQTAALQTVLTLAGYWTGPIDGIWSDELKELDHQHDDRHPGYGTRADPDHPQPRRPHGRGIPTSTS